MFITCARIRSWLQDSFNIKGNNENRQVEEECVKVPVDLFSIYREKKIYMPEIHRDVL